MALVHAKPSDEIENIDQRDIDIITRHECQLPTLSQSILINTFTHQMC